MTSEIITAIVSILGGGGVVIGLIKGGLLNIRIGTNGKDDVFKKLTDIAANHEARLEISNNEMGEVQKRVGNIETTVAKIDGKLDIIVDMVTKK